MLDSEKFMAAVRLDRSLWRDVKSVAAKLGKSLEESVTEALTNWLDSKTAKEFDSRKPKASKSIP